MTSAQVVETSVTNKSYFQNYPHPDDHTIRLIALKGHMHARRYVFPFSVHYTSVMERSLLTEAQAYYKFIFGSKILNFAK